MFKLKRYVRYQQEKKINSRIEMAQNLSTNFNVLTVDKCLFIIKK